MGDRELLELAAKGHGFIDDAVDGSEAHGLHRDAEGLFYWIDANGWVPWTPADDDGQALRLAVKRKIFRCHMDLFHRFYEEEIANGLDENAATRRAIVRAVVFVGEHHAKT